VPKSKTPKDKEAGHYHEKIINRRETLPRKDNQ